MCVGVYKIQNKKFKIKKILLMIKINWILKKKQIFIKKD